jgi:hypothetical protein
MTTPVSLERPTNCRELPAFTAYPAVIKCHVPHPPDDRGARVSAIAVVAGRSGGIQDEQRHVVAARAAGEAQHRAEQFVGQRLGIGRVTRGENVGEQIPG